MSETERTLMTLALCAATAILGYHLGLKAKAKAQAATATATAAPLDGTGWLMQYGGTWQ